jgi:hypothetical protein
MTEGKQNWAIIISRDEHKDFLVIPSDSEFLIVVVPPDTEEKQFYTNMSADQANSILKEPIEDAEGEGEDEA